jgi:hypothetical protein
MTDREVVEEFVANLRRLGHRDLEISSRPDEGNRKSQDVDAIAGPFAIEHTSVDTVPNQRRDSDYFLQVFGVLEDHRRTVLVRVVFRRATGWRLR